MADHATPNLPSRDFDVTEAFYATLGFERGWRDAGWMILHRGGLTVEFFLLPELDPATSAFGCCFRLDDLRGFFDVAVAANVPVGHTGWPRVHPPQREPWGGLVGALIDPDCSLIRLVQAPLG